MKKDTARESVLSSVYPHVENELTESLSEARPSDISHRNEVTRKRLIRTALSGAIRYTAMLACLLAGQKSVALDYISLGLYYLGQFLLGVSICFG